MRDAHQRSYNSLIGASLCLTLAGCGAAPSLGPIAGNPAPPTVVRVFADWNDIDAAALVAASKTETVVLASREVDPATIVLDVGTVRDEPVRVTAHRIGEAAGPDGSVEIELTCAYGRFGDGPQQQRFLDAMSRRLSDLKGVDYRKVR